MMTLPAFFRMKPASSADPCFTGRCSAPAAGPATSPPKPPRITEMKQRRSEEHTSELQSPDHLVCRLLLEKKQKNPHIPSVSERHSALLLLESRAVPLDARRTPSRDCDYNAHAHTPLIHL